VNLNVTLFWATFRIYISIFKEILCKWNSVIV
jgi:hypothetical protein